MAVATFDAQQWWKYFKASGGISSELAKRLEQCVPGAVEDKVFVIFAPPDDLAWLRERATAYFNNLLRPYGLKVRFKAQEQAEKLARSARGHYPRQDSEGGSNDSLSVRIYYRALREAVIRPDRIIRIPGYLLRWWGVVKGSGLSLLAAIYQVAYLHQGGRTVTLTEVARWAGTTKRTVVNNIHKPPYHLLVSTEERNGTVVHVPATPPLTPGDARMLAVLLAGGPQGIEQVLEMSPDEIKQWLGEPHSTREDMRQYGRYRSKILEASLALTGSPEAANETFGRLTAAIANAYGTVTFPWYMLKFRDEVGHTLFWYWVWLREQKAPPASFSEAALALGIARRTMSTSYATAHAEIVQALFPKGLFQQISEIPLLPKDEEVIIRWVKRLAEEGGKVVDEMPEELQETARKILANTKREPFLPPSWTWGVFARLPIDASVKAQIEASIEPSQFASALLTAGSNPRTQNVLAVAIYLALNNSDALRPCSLSPEGFFEALQDIVQWEHPREIDGHRVTVKAAREILEML